MMAQTTHIQVTVNGTVHGFDLDGDVRLLDVLRDELQLKGTRFGCGENQCGACFVLVDGFPVASCDTPLWSLAGKHVTTVEGLAPQRGCLSKIQDAFCETHAMQCGYCTPGMLVACHALVERTPQPDEAQIRDAIGGNLCRCTGYQQIVDAVKLATSPGYQVKDARAKGTEASHG